MARATWTSSISFGLVSIPVRVYSAIRAHDVRFHQLAPDGSRIHIERVSEKTGRKIEFKDIKKGYATTKGKWVVLDPEELKDLAPRTTKTIEIEDFVALEEIDPIYFERTYYLAPQNDAAAKASALLTSVMTEKQRVGIGKAPEPEPSAKLLDLTEALRASLESGGRRSGSRTRAKSKKATSKRTAKRPAKRATARRRSA